MNPRLEFYKKEQTANRAAPHDGDEAIRSALVKETISRWIDKRTIDKMISTEIILVASTDCLSRQNRLVAADREISTAEALDRDAVKLWRCDSNRR